MHRNLLRAGVASALSLVAVVAQGAQMPWRTDLTAARAEAQRDGKLVLVHFWTESCGPCRLLEKRVFSEAGVIDAIVRDYVPVKVNANDEPSIAQTFGVSRVPTDIVITASGRLVKAFVSPPTPVAYVGTVSELAASRRGDRGRYQAIASAAPFTSTPAGEQLPAPQQFLNPAYGQLQAATQLAMQQPATPPAAPAEPKPEVTINPNVAAEPPVSTAVKAPAASEPQTSTIASDVPTGTPPVGFDGYCPVTLRRDWKWEKGDAKWGAIHRGRTYLFVNEAARDEFLKRPDFFSPAFAGHDPVLAVEAQQAVPGVREHGVEFEGTYYLFSSEQTLTKFWSNPSAYTQHAQHRVAAAPSTAGAVSR